MKRIQRIVVATDFSDIAEHALDQAVALAHQLGASITLVNAYEIPMLSLPDGVVTATAEMIRQITTAGEDGLAAATKRHEASGVAMTSVLRMGPPWDEINAIAAAENADLIVVGTHGRRGLSRALLGSVSERLLRTATLPVLVVHAAAEA